MSTAHPITIIGGGLAGLTLGIGLRRQNVPVIVREAGQYPRHRVCGEFISGRGQGTLRRFGLSELFVRAGAVRATTAVFFSGPARSPVRPLPAGALCLSRYRMDELLAGEFRRLGGQLREKERGALDEFGAGLVRASGRRARPIENGWRWFGVKVHARNIALAADLEMHLASSGYVGLCRLGGGEVNVCGLFRRRTGAGEPAGRGVELLRGLPAAELQRRLAGAELDESSWCSVAGLSLQRARAGARAECCVGDALTMIPPVTGNGMSMAFESAELAVEPLAAYSRGECSWSQAQSNVARACDAAFARRLAWARFLQRMMFSPLCRGALGPALLRSEWLWQMLFDRTR